MPRPNRGPRLELNKRGIYEIRWTEQRRSKRLSTWTSDLREAQQVFAGWLAEAERTTAEQQRQTLTVETALEHYQAGHVARRVRDGDRQRQIIRWLTDGLGDKYVHDLDDDLIEAYKDARMAGVVGKRRVTESTVRRELNCLIAAINYCVKKRLLARDLVPHIPLPEESAPKEFWFTEEETDQLLATAARLSDKAGRLTRAHRFTAIALATAARKGVIERLTWPLVEWRTGLIRYDRQLDPVTGHTMAQTKKRRVAVPMADWLIPVLERAHAERQTELVLDHDKTVRRALEKLGRDAAEEWDNPRFLRIHPHVLRHTAATQMLRAGEDVWTVAGVLGDTVATVMRTYGHHAADHLRRGVNFRTPQPAKKTTG